MITSSTPLECFVKSLSLAAFLASIGGCSQGPRDGDPHIVDDASTRDDGATDDEASSPDGASTTDDAPSADTAIADDGSPDAACKCGWDPDVGASIGMYTLECYCGQFGPCPDYETARASCGPVYVQQGCDLEVVLYKTPAFEPTFTLVYSSTTHELVGAESTENSPSLPCNGRSVVRYRAGYLPWQWCKPMAILDPSCQDAGLDGDAVTD